MKGSAMSSDRPASRRTPPKAAAARVHARRPTAKPAVAPKRKPVPKPKRFAPPAAKPKRTSSAKQERHVTSTKHIAAAPAAPKPAARPVLRDNAQPASAKPASAKPASTKSAAKPAASKPGAAKPGAAKPELAKPVSARRPSPPRRRPGAGKPAAPVALPGRRDQAAGHRRVGLGSGRDGDAAGRALAADPGGRGRAGSATAATGRPACGGPPAARRGHARAAPGRRRAGAAGRRGGAARGRRAAMVSVPAPRVAPTPPSAGGVPIGPQRHMPPPRPLAKAESFVEGDHVVYPTHGVGKVERIATEEIAGHKLELIHITFEENRMTLRVPVAKARTAGLRKLATPQDCSTRRWRC